MSASRRVAGGLGAAALVTWGPMTASIAPLRRRAAPRLAGLSDDPHVALTFDDGPDPVSTPPFLDLLERHGRTATFFLLGEHVLRHSVLVEEMAARGHELAVHGWDHRCVALKRPGRLASELRRTRDLVAEVSGQAVTWYRPPYGVLTGESLLAARAAGLCTVLWSAWGRDWEAGATAPGIVRSVDRGLSSGGTVLLHDTDRTSAPDSWRRTLLASEVLLGRWGAAGQSVGPLAEHWTGHRVPGKACSGYREGGDCSC